jgi:hypothetical protein
MMVMMIDIVDNLLGYTFPSWIDQIPFWTKMVILILTMHEAVGGARTNRAVDRYVGIPKSVEKKYRVRGKRTEPAIGSEESNGFWSSWRQIDRNNSFLC